MKVLEGDCLDVMPTLGADSIDAIVTDPPYGLAFMGKDWDHGVPSKHFWREALRVAKPGAHLVAFGGTRTHHRLMVAIEDAGWEIRDCLGWIYGSGFPKSLDVSKAIDATLLYGGSNSRRIKAAIAGRPDARSTATLPNNGVMSGERRGGITADTPTTDLAERWQGWGTALKPAWEPIILARKPLSGTVASNVTEYGTGAINVDGCRVGTEGGGTHCDNRDENGKCLGHGNAGRSTAGETFHGPETETPLGRWPANILHDGSDEVRDLLCEAARFFYCAKASKSDRDEGLDDRNGHPTVKPTALMRWLVRLVTPPGGTVLDPFTGSGSTGKAAVMEGFDFIGIEREPEYAAIARARIEHAIAIPKQEALL